MQKLNKSLTFSKLTLRIKDDEMDQQHVRFLQGEIRDRSLYFMILQIIVITITIMAKLVESSDAQDWGFEILIVVQVAAAIGSLVAFGLVRLNKDKFTSLIGPLVFSSYTVAACIMVINTSNLLLVYNITNMAVVVYGIYIFTLTDRFIPHCLLRNILLATLFALNSLQRVR